MPSLVKLFQQLISEPKLKKRPRKRPRIENKAKHNNLVKVETLDKKSTIKQLQISAKDSYDPAA